VAARAETDDKRRIVVCYDGSAESARALARVVEIALAVPSEVTIVSVAGPIYEELPYTGYTDPIEEETHHTLLDDAARSLKAHGLTSTTLEPVGDTVPAILRAARDTRADMIVVGSRHRSLIRRLLFGSVSGELAVEAPFDVLVVH
jgi:nucleotide-binding universal stress UspA family protein